MARKGLGKGLDSLIPNIYDENFDSNSPQSLEDMLKENEENTVEEVVEDIKSKNESDDVKEIKDDEDDKTDSSTSQGSQEVAKESPEEETEEEPSQDDQTSEDLPGDKSGEDDIQTSQKLEVKQEHIDEVIEIVEKNPRITLWSSKSSAVFRYLRKTEPEFSISKEASILIEEAVSKKYPEIWELFKDL